jgi:hypothetical protein|tara:strand:+ start:1489 stop:1671 length:183 start_codon:yes stop_codon:yes gene_type:complete
MKKTKHDYKCDICGKPATINIQDWWQKYAITEEGDFMTDKDWEGDTSEFYCDKCEEKQTS